MASGTTNTHAHTGHHQRRVLFLTGGWVAMVSAGRVMVVNLFSRAKVVLPTKQGDYSIDPSKISKIIFSEEPTSETCILAAITHGCMVALCGVSSAKGWTMKACGMGMLKDIAFYHGELYVLQLDRPLVRLLKFGISGGANEVALVTTIQAVVIHSLPYLLWEEDDDVDVHTVYIFEMGNKLTMAVKTGEYFFRLFELVIDVNYRRWEEMTSLHDYALFLGPTCSMAVEVCAEGRGGVQRNHIYYSNERYGHVPSHKRYLTKMADGRIVYYDDDEIVCYDRKVIISQGFYGERGVQAAMWLVPPHV
ncbi:uncharacterized protein [Aegilops tauschii subsp. strangulata]|uniref:KIB1-4 beta-propeller domain-containing protein n=1 Tax=Aegilops tauschii TaxID=37682 RepID=R7VYH5_AEGTA|nr:uncharacterized protein LOC109784618 [Aegilops tauschii subsp. strangulata]